MTGRWFLKSSAADIGLMSKSLGISPTTASVLANRGLRTRDEALDFLYPEQKKPFDASAMKDIEKAAVIIRKACENGGLIAVYGDYDVDGVVSAYILYSNLKKYGGNVIYYLPLREEDGYGLNAAAVKSLRGRGVELIITCDNGISAHGEISTAKELGMDVVVIDHHDVTRENGRDLLPPADAVVNPKREDCPYPCKTLCAGALCLEFIRFFYKYLDMDFEDEAECLELAALASVCDVVPLVSETRGIVGRGLRSLNSTRGINRGLDALIRLRGLEGKKISAFSLGYIIGPCLNAAGRLEAAELALSLFLAEDGERASALAERLVELNEKRKALTAVCVEDAVKALREKESLDGVIVYFDEKTPESLAGIVAGRLKEEFWRPIIVLTDSGDLIKGSARSVEGFNIFGALSECKELFVKYGGHDMAAGLTMSRENIKPFRKKINTLIQLNGDDFTPLYRLEKQLALSDITFELARELRLLEPFGAGAAEPIFGTKGAIPDVCEVIGESGKTLRFVFSTEDGRRKIRAVCFNKLDDFVGILRAKFAPNVVDAFLCGKIKNLRLCLDIIYNIEINEYNGNEYLRSK
jgi:single-stranded-DNA-specific exonuclease